MGRDKGPTSIINGHFLQDLSLCFASSWWIKLSVSTSTPSPLPRSFPSRRHSPMSYGASSTARPTPSSFFCTWWMLASQSLSGFGPWMPISRWVNEARTSVYEIFNQVTQRLAYTISNHWAHWLELFYHQHRMAHLPKVHLPPSSTQTWKYFFLFKVYEHAHKLHHYLHGSLSLDAHIYGGPS